MAGDKTAPTRASEWDGWTLRSTSRLIVARARVGTLYDIESRRSGEIF